jgi:hypothetical protein
MKQLTVTTLADIARSQALNSTKSVNFRQRNEYPKINYHFQKALQELENGELVIMPFCTILHKALNLPFKLLNSPLLKFVVVCLQVIIQ